MPNNLFVSFMRTVVPIVAGLLLGLAAHVGLDLDDATVATQVTATLTAAYYGAFRLLEEAAGRVGWPVARQIAGALLGWARPPEYGGVRPGATVRLTVDQDHLARQLRHLADRHPDVL